jgi:predicted outer membrane repeat protein
VSFKNIKSLGQNGGAILINSGGTLELDSGTRGSEEVIVFQGNSASNGGAIYVGGENAVATLRGNIKFENNTSYYDGGAIYNNGGTLEFILRANDQIIFSDASSLNSDSMYNGVYNQNGSITIEGVSGGLFRLGRYVFIGQNFGGNSLSIKGGLELGIGGGVVQKSITFEDSPTLSFTVWSWDNIGHMSVSEEGTVSGSANIAVTMAEDVEHFPQRNFSYLEYADGVNVDLFQPTLVQETIEHGGVEYGVSLGNSLLSREVVLQRENLTGNVGERFIVREGRTVKIYDAAFADIDSGNLDGSGGALEIETGAMALVKRSVDFDFSGNIGGTGGAGAIKIAEGGTLRIDLENADDVMEFENNRIGGAEGPLLDINNGGEIVVEKGILEFSKGGITGDGTLTMEGPSVLNVGSAKIDQKTMSFGEDVKIILNIGSFDSAIDDADFDRATRGGSGGMLYAGDEIELSPLVGSPKVDVTFSDDALEDLMSQPMGTVRQYKYLYMPDNADLSGFTPKFSSKLFKPRGSSLWVKLDFLTSEDVVDRENQGMVNKREFSVGHDKRVLTYSSAEPKDVVGKIVENVPGISEVKKKGLAEFISSMLEKDAEVGESVGSENIAKLNSIYSQYNPDSNIALQTEAAAASLQSLGDMIADRVSETGSSSSSSTAEPAAGLLVAAAEEADKVSYGLLKDESSTKNLSSRIWARAFGSVSEQKLEEDTKTQNYGFITGIDSKFGDRLKLGLAYSISLDGSKGDLREKNTTTHSLSIYGDYRSGFGGLAVSAIVTYGLTQSKGNKLSGSGSIFYLAPTIGYTLALLESKFLALSITPEIGLRYFRIYQGEQKTDSNKIDPVTGETIVAAPALRISALLMEKLELAARYGQSYDLHSRGDSSYTVTMYDGNSYKITDENDKKAKSSTEIGATIGFRFSDTLKLSLGCGRKYSSDLTNTSASLEVGLKF